MFSLSGATKFKYIPNYKDMRGGYDKLSQARYAMQLEAEASSVKGGQLFDMEREQYQNQIKDLLQAVETLLKSNNALGERVAQLEKVAEAHEDLKARYAKLEGELAMRKRGQHGKKSEKP